jgi:hypothetical protein
LAICRRRPIFAVADLENRRKPNRRIEPET